VKPTLVGATGIAGTWILRPQWTAWVREALGATDGDESIVNFTNLETRRFIRFPAVIFECCPFSAGNVDNITVQGRRLGWPVSTSNAK